MRSELSSQLAHLSNCGRVGVGTVDFIPFAKEVDEVTPAPAAGVEDAHAGRDAAAQELIEEINVDGAELLGEGGHSFVLHAIRGYSVFKGTLEAMSFLSRSMAATS